MGAKNIPKYVLFMTGYGVTIYCLCHFDYTPALMVISKAKANPIVMHLGEWLKDSECGNSLFLYLLFTAWIPNLVNIIMLHLFTNFKGVD